MTFVIWHFSYNQAMIAANTFTGRDDEMWLGYFEEYPELLEHQGESEAEIQVKTF